MNYQTATYPLLHADLKCYAATHLLTHPLKPSLSPFLSHTPFSHSSTTLYNSPLVSFHFNTVTNIVIDDSFFSLFIYPFINFSLIYSLFFILQNTHKVVKMSSVCAEQHKFHPSHQQLLTSKKSLRDIDIPPRKLLTRRAITATHDMFSDDTIFQKFLPYNDPVDSDDNEESDDPYSSDHFRMYEFKVRRCTRSRSHDWTDCPFAHPGEKARRRDPRRYHYSGTVCQEYRRGGCSRGDGCEFAHGVFECWLHPARYRTEACKDGKNCKRKVCFFAHTPRQLRILPVNSHTSSNGISISCKKNKKFLNPSSSGSNNTCCLFCHCAAASATAANASPTSTLFNITHFSPPLSPSSSPTSPPLSPVRPGNRVSPVSRYGPCGGGVNHHHHGVVSHKDVLTELMSSLEGLKFGEGSPVSAAKATNLNWLDVSLNCEDQQQFILSPSASSLGIEDQQQFILSPSSQTPTSSSGKFSSNKFFNNDDKVVGVDVNGSSCATPDLGWVNELLM